MAPKISVIIPVYNSEKYIEETLNSALNQTLIDIEVVCVDDGSSDASNAIIKGVGARDSRVVLLRQQNMGPSAARNAGIIKATGEYIVFLDSDDMFFDNTALEEIYNHASTLKLDQLMFDVRAFYETEELEEKFPDYKTYYKRRFDYVGVMQGKKLYVLMQENKDFKVSTFVECLRREFLIKNKLYFEKNIKSHEDNVFTTQCTMLSKRSAYVNKVFYTRRVREDSLVTNPDNFNSVWGCYLAVKALTRFFGERLTAEDRDVQKAFMERIFALEDTAGKIYISETNGGTWGSILDRVSDEERGEFFVTVRTWATSRRRWERASDRKQKIKELKGQNKELEAQNKKLKAQNKKLKGENKKLKGENKKIKNSHSYKLARAITFIPRKIRKIFMKNA